MELTLTNNVIPLDNIIEIKMDLKGRGRWQLVI